MKIFNVVRKNTYYDSVALMVISKQLKQLEGIDDVSVMMGTPANRVILDEAGLLNEDGAAAGPNDLIMAFRAAPETEAQKICQLIDKELAKKTAGSECAEAAVLRSAEKAYQEMPDANLAFISIPGEYAFIEAYRALKHGKNVFLFSDNVSIGEEARLKQVAAEKGLMVMGPDCGTAIINGVGIGFANRVRRGNVGLVAASGTGLQEVTCLLDALGLGVSQAIGTGGRDLKEEIGAVTMHQALDFLLADPATEIVILISKPPAAPVAEKILARLTGTTKKVVLCFIGYSAVPPEGISITATLEEASLQAARLSGLTPALTTPDFELAAKAEEARGKLAAGQRYVRALYAGGTLCYEAMLILSQHLGPVYSNIPLTKDLAIKDVAAAGKHIAVDLGDDEFTRGRPHPMIDGSLRNEYIARVAADPETAVLLVDVVIGFGAGEDPAGDLVSELAAAREKAAAAGSRLAVVAYVCGTDRDNQCKRDQVAKLEQAGVLVARTNAEAARLAAMIARKGEGVNGQ